MPTHKLCDSFIWLYDRRITRGKTLEEMANESGVSVSTIRRRLYVKGLK